MTLAASGEMSIGGTTTNRSINVEFGISATATTSMSQLYRGGGIVTSNNTSVPTSGAISISNFYGATSRPAPSYTFSSNTADSTINVTTLSGYVAGISDIVITINSSIWVYATSTGNAGLTLTGGAIGDTLKIINNGYIAGMGGAVVVNQNAGAGGTALSLGFNTTIDNTNSSAYIGGGGGGGGGASYGGGGAGGGTTMDASFGNLAGGGPGAAGQTGATNNGLAGGGGGGAGGGGAGSTTTGSGKSAITIKGLGGSGGRIFPGTGGAGGAGGDPGGAGGSANGGGGDGNSGGASGGGGGWGAAGGSHAGGSWPAGGGGKAVALNGNTVTWVSGDTTRVYGSVS